MLSKRPERAARSRHFYCTRSFPLWDAASLTAKTKSACPDAKTVTSTFAANKSRLAARQLALAIGASPQPCRGITADTPAHHFPSECCCPVDKPARKRSPKGAGSPPAANTTPFPGFEAWNPKTVFLIARLDSPYVSPRCLKPPIRIRGFQLQSFYSDAMLCNGVGLVKQKIHDQIETNIFCRQHTLCG